MNFSVTSMRNGSNCGALRRSFPFIISTAGSATRSRPRRFVALDAEGTILGIVNLVYLSSNATEVALVIRSDHRRRGISRSLLVRAIRWAEDNGLSQLIGYVHTENRIMLALARKMGFQGVRWDSFLFEIRRPVSP